MPRHHPSRPSFGRASPKQNNRPRGRSRGARITSQLHRDAIDGEKLERILRRGR